MRDLILFALLPYAALALAAAGLLAQARAALRPGPGDAADPAGDGEAPKAATRWLWLSRSSWLSRLGRWSWYGGLGLLLALHALVLLLPAAAAAASRRPAVLAALEGAGLACGGLALAGLVITLLARGSGRRPASTITAIDALFLGLLAVELASGLAVGLLFRWGAVWSAATVSPYLASLLRLRPEVALVAGLPALVRLHLIGGFAALAVLPFTRAGAALVRPLCRLVGRLIRRFHRMPSPAGTAAGLGE